MRSADVSRDAAAGVGDADDARRRPRGGCGCAIEPRSPVSPTASSIACAALTSRLRTTWLMSPPWQITGGQRRRGRWSTSATYLYSLRATVSVVLIASLRSTGRSRCVGGCANSLHRADDARRRARGPRWRAAKAAGHPVAQVGRGRPAPRPRWTRVGCSAATGRPWPCVTRGLRRLQRHAGRRTPRAGSWTLSPTNWIGVLISWAMPAARRPTASSFWARRSSISSALATARFSEMSNRMPCSGRRGGPSIMCPRRAPDPLAGGIHSAM